MQLLMQKCAYKGPFIFYEVGACGGLVGFGGVGHAKKMAFKGADPKKIREKGRSHSKIFCKTLKWHTVLINEVLKF